MKNKRYNCETTRHFNLNGVYYKCHIKTTDTGVNFNTLMVSDLLSGKEQRAFFSRIIRTDHISKKSEKIEIMMADLKKTFGSVALQQALRASGLSYAEIAFQMNISRRVAWNNTNGIQGCILWENRSNQKQLLSIAKFLIKVTGGSNENN